MAWMANFFYFCTNDKAKNLARNKRMPRHQGKARVHKGGNTFSIVIKLYLKKKNLNPMAKLLWSPSRLHCSLK